MKIEKIMIMNYRGIADSGWINFNDMNAIIGRNDAGKSSILHAISSFYNDSKLVDGDKYYGACNNETIIEIMFGGEEVNNLPAILKDSNGKLHIKKSAIQVGESYKNTIFVYDFENSAYQNIFQVSASKYVTLSRELSMEPLSKYEYIGICEIVEHLLSMETTYVEKEYEIKSIVLKNLLKEIYPQYSLFLADTSLDTGASSFQNQFKRIITTAIEAHIDAFNNLTDEVSTTLTEEVCKIGEFMSKHYPSMKDLIPDISYDWQKLVNFDVVMRDNAEYEVRMSNKGTGIQRLFMVSYFQYLADQSNTEKVNYIFALEEPETFLHPGAQRTLLESLKKISETHQVIITTHSPVFASEISKENITVATKKDSESIYKQGEEISSDLIIDELGIRASDNIISSKLIVFVEGSNDVKFWQLVYNKIKGHNYEEDGILMIPGGGTELHNIAEMNLMSKLNRNFMVIVDKDSGAVDYEEKLAKQNKLKELIEPKGGELIVLRKREIENYYSPDIVKTMLNDKGAEIGELTIEDYEDVQKKLKQMFEGINIQFKFKNNMDVFLKMELEDWRNVSTYAEEGVIHFELEEIVNKILDRAN